MYLKVFVTPNARREEVRERRAALAIAVREPAKGNRANTRVREIVAARLALPLSAVRIVSGYTSRAKMLSIRD